MNQLVKLLVAGIAVLFVGAAQAATEWNTQDYDLYPGDFDGDGRTDVLYVAKDQSKASGIAISDGNAPNVPFQSWPSNFAGIQWYGNLYRPIVADFNGDGKSDILMQRATPGDHFLLFADAEGKITGNSQGIGNNHLGIAWSGDQHTIVAGDFTGDGKADVFLQTASPSVNSYIVAADGNGLLTVALQSWPNTEYGLKWSTKDAYVYAGDFDNNGKADLLVQARPKIVMIDYEIPIPVPTYTPNTFGMVLSQGGSTPFIGSGARLWSRNSYGVDWSPLSANLVIGNFDGNPGIDVLLQARNSSRPSYLVAANGTASVFATGTQLATNVTWSADSFRLLAGNFDGTGGAGVYFQSTSSGGTNYYANTVTGASVVASSHDPVNPTGTAPATAVGHTVGSFAVSNTGSATYSIPIVVPPGISGIQPSLSINYASGSGNGLLGVGWDLDGLSEIERCGKTLAQDNSTDGVLLTTADRFCLDGNKLRLTGGTYGLAGSTYQTELETFARVEAVGTANNPPTYFQVQGKDGLIYTYGFTLDSRIEAVNSASPGTVYAWALSEVRDRSGNTMSISYQEDGAPNGSYRPSQIVYTTNTGAGVSTAAYKVVFVWESRPATDVLIHYVAGGRTTEPNRLNRIETQYQNGGSWELIRKYQLSYNNSSASGRSRLKSVQECGRDGSCLSPTIISWQDGLKGWPSADTAISSSDSSAKMESSYPIDFDGDGFTDLVYPQGDKWYFMRANGIGGFGSPSNTGIDATNPIALALDYFGEGKTGLMVSPSGYSTRQILRWNGSTLVATNTNISVTFQGREWVADFDGDARPDFLYSTYTSGAGYFYVQKNQGSTTSGQFATAVSWYSNTMPMATSPFVGSEANRTNHVLDFNGDGRTDLLYQVTQQSCGSFGCGGGTTTWTALLSTGSSFQFSQTWTCTNITIVDSCSAAALPGDFNGDGFTDIVYNTDYTTQFNWEIRYGSSAGLGPATSLPGSSPILVAQAYANTFAADYDGDGRSDIVYASMPQSGGWNVLRSLGTTFEAPVPIPLASTSDNKAVRAFDLDGDGQLDLGYKSTQYRVKRHNGSVADFMSSISDGFGNTISISYAPLTDSSIYAKCTGTTPVECGAPSGFLSGATFPVIDLRVPLYVVKQYTASDGIGGSYAVFHNYVGARAHAQGRGFLGFASRSTVDNRNNVKNTTIFRQDFPYIGLAYESTTYQSDNTVIAQATNTLAELTVQGTPLVNDRHLPYVQQSVQDSREVGGASNGSLIARVTTTSALDSWGNPTSITTLTEDLTGTAQSFTSVTSNAYNTGDSDCWWRGFVTQQQVTNTVPGLAAQARTVQYVKDSAAPTLCRVQQQIVEPGAGGSITLTKTFAYDAFGHPNSETVSGVGITSRTTTTSFGTRGVFPESVTNALGQSASKTYDYALGVPLSATDPNGLTVNFQYDGFGRLLRETRPDGTKTAFAYSACTSANNYCGDSRLRYRVQKQELDATNPGVLIRQSAQLFDAFGRSLYDQSQTVSGAYSNVATNYDNQGRAWQRSQPYFSGLPAYFTTITYDLLGRPTKEERRISESDSGLQNTLYGYNRLTHTQTDANGRTTTKLMNAIGQVIQTADANGGVTHFEYDQFGNLKKTIDPLNNEIRNEFNVRGFKTQTRDPDMGTWDYTYYPTGELYTQTDAKSQVVTFTYDTLGRPLTRVEPEGTATFIYGTTGTGPNRNIGRLASVSSPGSFSETFTYDSLARLQTSTTNASASSFQVDNSYNTNTGLLETTTYPTSTTAVAGSRFKVKYEYDYGLLKRTRDFNTPATIYWEQVATNAAGQAIDEQLGNGLHTYSYFDGITGLLGTRQSGSSNQVQKLAYQWDKVGNLTQRRDVAQNLTEDFYYDNLNRLDYSRLNGVATPNLDVGYDALGNITSKTSIGSYTYSSACTGSTRCAAATRPHAVSAAGGNSYAYDYNGNMTTRNGSSIAWTSYNLPSTINKGGNSSQFFYGADRQRYKQIAVTAAGGSLPAGTETTIYVGSLYERVTKPSGVIEHKHTIMAGGEAIAIRTLRSNSANDTRYLHKDHLGSVDVITNESGTVVQRLSYDAFGKRRDAAVWAGAPNSTAWTNIASITHRAFTFHEQLDNVDLVHMNGRVYDPDIGRFISADPFIQAPLMSQSLNRYSYVINNPLSLIDPSGYLFGLKKLWHGIKHAFRSIANVLTRAVQYTIGAVLVVAGVIAAAYGQDALAAGLINWGLGFFASGTAFGGGGGSRAGPQPSSGGFGTASPNGGYGRGWNGTYIPDGAMALDPPSLPEWAVNAGTGFGDGVSWGATFFAGDLSTVRRWLDIDGGVDEESAAYRYARWGGVIPGLVLGARTTAGVGTLVARGVAYARTRIAAALTVDKAAATARTAFEGKSITELTSTISREQHRLITEFFGRGLPGIEKRLGDFRIPEGLTRETLETYAEIARRGIGQGLDEGGKILSGRLEIIERALRQMQ